MAVDPIIQELIELVEPPVKGHRPVPTSGFGRARSNGSNPHVGFDVNRGRGVQPNGPVTSPVFGVIGDIDPKLGRIVIHEVDPVTKEFTGYDVEILHTQTRTVTEGDKVKPTQQIGTQGDVGAEGAFHAHIQVFHGDRTPLNPLKHLYEYHHPGEPVPPLSEFEPLQVPPRRRAGTSHQDGEDPYALPGQAKALPSITPQLVPGMPIPGAEGPTSIGGPAGPKPVVPPAQPRSQIPAARPRDSSPVSPPLNFAPEPRPNFGPFTLQGPSHSDAGSAIQGGQDRPNNAPVAAAAVIPPRQASRPMPSSVDAARRPSVQIGDGGGIGNWWDGSPVVRQSSLPDDGWADIPMPRISPEALPAGPTPDAGPVRNSAAWLSGPVGDSFAGNDAPGSGSAQSPQGAADLLAGLYQLSRDTDLFASKPSSPVSRPSLANANDEQTLPSPPLVPFPLQALLADDPSRALEDWAASPSRVQAARPVQDAPGGLLGLFASVAGLDPANPFVPTPLEEEVPVRRLVSRPVRL